MATQLLYNTEELEDVIIILNFINEYTKAMGLKDVVLDTNKIQGVVNGCRADFPHIDGLQKASAFKQTANFVCHFIAERPIYSPFSLGDECLSKIDNHQNAIVAFALAESALNKSTIQKNNGDIEVAHPIKYSRHSYIDIIDALANTNPVIGYKLVTVLLEQLVYKSNPECQYSIS